MCYGYGVNDYALSVGYGYPGCNNMGPMGAGYTSAPSLNPQVGSNSEGEGSAYKKAGQKDDTGIKIGATILASIAIAGLMIKGARGKNIKATEEAVEKAAKGSAKEKIPEAKFETGTVKAGTPKVNEEATAAATHETETLLNADGNVATDTAAEGAYYNSEGLVKINGTLSDGSRYSSKYDPNTNLKTKCSYYNKDGELTRIEKFTYDDEGKFLTKTMADAEGNVYEVPYDLANGCWDYLKQTQIK